MTDPEAGPRRPPPPVKPKNDDVRGREYLTEDEVDSLRKAALAAGLNGHRDATMILIAYTHGLRITELVRLRWDQVDMKAGTLHVRRLKKGVSGTHPLRRLEVQALRKLCPQEGTRRGVVFKSNREAGIAPRTFFRVVARAGVKAGFAFPVHPHMLRHGCGYKLTNEGHDTRSIQAWLGHKNIQHTVRYTELSPDRFARLKFWDD